MTLAEILTYVYRLTGGYKLMPGSTTSWCFASWGIISGNPKILPTTRLLSLHFYIQGNCSLLFNLFVLVPIPIYFVFLWIIGILFDLVSTEFLPLMLNKKLIEFGFTKPYLLAKIIYDNISIWKTVISFLGSCSIVLRTNGKWMNNPSCSSIFVRLDKVTFYSIYAY